MCLCIALIMRRPPKKKELWQLCRPRLTLLPSLPPLLVLLIVAPLAKCCVKGKRQPPRNVCHKSATYPRLELERKSSGVGVAEGV